MSKTNIVRKKMEVPKYESAKLTKKRLVYFDFNK